MKDTRDLRLDQREGERETEAQPGCLCTTFIVHTKQITLHICTGTQACRSRILELVCPLLVPHTERAPLATSMYEAVSRR
jgi:hypothetical protein